MISAATFRVLASSLALCVVVCGIGVPPSWGAGESDCAPARRACLDAARAEAHACKSDCRGLAQRSRRLACLTSCKTKRAQVRGDCQHPFDACRAACGSSAASPSQCNDAVRLCRAAAVTALDACRSECLGLPFREERRRCRRDCLLQRAEDERGCGFTATRGIHGAATLPDFANGQPADLTLLTDAERAVIAAADERAVSIRQRPVRIAAPPGTSLRLAQVRHHFEFGLALDTAKFVGREDDLDFFLRTGADNHVSRAVTESSAKWNRVEPQPGVRDFSLADRDVATARAYGYRVKGHPLNWGITPPFSSSGAPPWALDRYRSLPLPPRLLHELRATLRAHVEALVGRYRDDIDIWDVTNETLQPLAQWTVQRLGPKIVEDLFRWAHAADPDCLLVFNEWIVEVFTGFPQPTAADVRDRVLELRAAGVPVQAIGQQAHFTPAAAFAVPDVDLSGRTPLDAYAAALDTLAEAGLPIHLTETNFIAPDDPERRAAQAEGLMRLWWGHPAVEQIVFWGLWNAVAGRDEFDVGLWDDDRNVTRHGAAIFSLLNDRWRTDVEGVVDAEGFFETVATFGEYLVLWERNGTPVHARVSIQPAPGRLTIALVDP